MALRSSHATTLEVQTPMQPPLWAFLERELVRSATLACEEFFQRYFDERGYLLCIPRWGGNDGPDDAIENITGWPILYALGADPSILRMIRKAWEGHLLQYTEAKTVEVPFARGGMYYKEFPVMFDWLHNGESLTAFNLEGLTDPYDLAFQRRVRRYAGFYMNEDPQAPNYDPQHRIIRSLFNGSRGPLLRKATSLDWAGDPIEVEGRFSPLHGERSYEEMLAHFKDYTDIVGDHPSNLAATTLALNAYMLTGEPKYKEWLLEYVDAWVERTEVNGGIIPSNIGLDGTIGGACDGKWYGGCYGWGFTTTVPQTGAIAHRNTIYRGIAGFVNALLVTGEQRYIDLWGTMLDTIASNARTIDGQMMYPHMYGDEGWYDFRAQPLGRGALDVYYCSMDEDDLERLNGNAWISYLHGNNPDYPVTALQRDLNTVRQKVMGIREDTTTPDTRLSDDTLAFNPAVVSTLIHLMLGGLVPQHGEPLHARVRYFDPVNRRPGMPADVAALVEQMSDNGATLALVNINQAESRTVLIQAGAYAEHQFVDVSFGGQRLSVNRPFFTVHLAPGAGGRIKLGMKRYVNQPTLAFPWA